ncbi:MAG: T9SS type A sorting domain-containing protein [Bacteroidales bacterium]|nr:T9SS type A sorting domain-containing protein [Bacteroidales bacterium]
MKTLIFIFALLAVPAGILAQTSWWSDPVPITDSLHNNRNISIPPFYYLNGDSLWCVWEVQENTETTSLMCRNLTSTATAFSLLAQQGVHFRNPSIFQEPLGDTLFFVYYETNQSGNWDVYYIGYLGNGQVSQPVPVCISPDDETCFTYMPLYGAVWQKSNDILYQPFAVPGGFAAGSQPQILSMGESRNPVFTGEYVVWEQPVGGDVHIYCSEYQYPSGFGPVVPVTVDGINANPSLGAGFPGWYLVWQQFIDDVWRLQAAELYTYEPLTVEDFPLFNNIDPVYSEMVIGVEGGYPFMPPMLVFASDTTSEFEVYGYEDFFSPVYINLSAYPVDDVDPNLFTVWNFEPGHGNLILTWESNRNGFWQIWMRDMDIFVAMPECQSSDNSQDIKIIPNPSDGFVTLDFMVSETGRYLISLYSGDGKMVGQEVLEILTPGKQQVSWAPVVAGIEGKLPGGTYLIRIWNGREAKTGKLILN